MTSIGHLKPVAAVLAAVLSVGAVHAGRISFQYDDSGNRTNAYASQTIVTRSVGGGNVQISAEDTARICSVSVFPNPT